MHDDEGFPVSVKLLLSRRPSGSLRIALLTGAVLLIALVTAPQASAQSRVGALLVADMVCEVAPDQRPEAGGENLRHEYVVLQNTLDTPLDMTGWTLENARLMEREVPDVFTFPDGFVLLPGAEVTVRTGVGDDTLTDLYWDRTEEAYLNNAGDGVIIHDAEGEFIMSQECAAFSFGCPDVTATALENGSVELRFGFGDGLDPQVWHIYRADTPGPDSFEEIATLPGHADAFMDSTAPEGTALRYIVVGEFGNGRGQGCAEVSVTSIPYFPAPVLGMLALVGGVGAYAWMRRR